MIKKDPREGKQSVGLPVVSGKLESCHFRNPIRGPRTEGGFFGLRSLFCIAEHFTRSGKVKSAMRRLSLDRGEHVVRAVEIGIDGGEFVFKGIGYEALGREVVTLIRFHTGNDIKEGGVTFHGGAVDGYPVEETVYAPHTGLGVLQGYASDDTVYFISSPQEPFCQITPVLACNACDKRFFHVIFPPITAPDQGGDLPIPACP